MQPKKFSIGIDIGGTNTTSGIVNRHGEILVEEHIKTADYATPAHFVKAIKACLESHINHFGRDEIKGIGAGAPNANYYTGEIQPAPNLPWKEVIPLRQLLEDAFDLPATITNDANASAIGEMTYGAAKGMKNFIMITLGTGLGSGFVANGQLIYGHDGFAGELGHVIAVRDGRLCNCGRRGCLERYSSATGIVLTAHEMLEASTEDESTMPENWLLPIYKGGAEITSSGIHKAALEGDPTATAIFDFTGRILGQTLADAVAYTSPQAIILFGGLAKAGDFILEPTKKYMEENLLSIYKNKIDIIPSGLSERDAAILGAAALAWE
ncbi:ROK family protein [Taibaiella lutea]|uniref:ROK family protein n=1 Tax=Taibaiella lutea TaxID=2608001 RepID=A0A5M6CBM5_9BACT|nr:ROK family protein [Taibaiella lutea]KAA5532441.1 ROK family protein [Taibaiella lutea]